MNTIMYPHQIEIDGARADDDQHLRIYRIHRIIGYAQALADLDNNEVFYKKIKSIYDHKGILIIAYNSAPSENEKDYLEKAWNSIVTDYESNPIDHEIA